MTSFSQVKKSFDLLSQQRVLLRKIGVALAVIVFAVGIFLALKSAPDLVHRIKLGPYLVLVCVAVPFTAGLNTIEFRLLALMAGKRATWLNSFEVSVYTSAANMLPIPGGLITRTAAMRAHGVHLRTSVALTISFLALWAASAFCYSGYWLMYLGQTLIGLSFELFGFLVLAACITYYVRSSISWLQVMAAMLIRIAGLVLEAVRLMFAGWSLGMMIGFDQASIFSTAAVVGSTISIVPAGLGIAEAAVALLSPLAGIVPSSGFLMAVANRIAVMLGLLLLLALLMAGKKWSMVIGSVIRLLGRRPGKNKEVRK